MFTSGNRSLIAKFRKIWMNKPVIDFSQSDINISWSRLAKIQTDLICISFHVFSSVLVTDCLLFRRNQFQIRF